MLDIDGEMKMINKIFKSILSEESNSSISCLSLNNFEFIKQLTNMETSPIASLNIILDMSESQDLLFLQTCQTPLVKIYPLMVINKL